MSKIIENKILYSYNDITIKPTEISRIKHRSEVNPFDENGFLPIFASPMTSVVDEINFGMFEDNNIIPILPRSSSLEVRLQYINDGRWAAFSLQEFSDIFTKKTEYDNMHVLIDVANGHMAEMYDMVSSAKKIHGKHLVVMVGNIANPETYRIAAQSGVDYVRCGIGGGDCCITTTLTGIGYPMASLISDISKVKDSIKSGNPYANLPKIVADGNIRGTDDVIKALALGADYVMIGSLFGRKLESAGECKIFTSEGNIDINNGMSLLTDERFLDEGNGNFFFEGKNARIMKVVYGMASEMGQKAIGSDSKVAEGLTKVFPCDGTIEEWCKIMEHALRSAMSYCFCQKLTDIFNNMEVCVITQNAYNAINR